MQMMRWGIGYFKRNIIFLIGISLCCLYFFKLNALIPIDSIDSYFDRASLYNEYVKIQALFLTPGLLCLAWWLSSLQFLSDVGAHVLKMLNSINNVIFISIILIVFLIVVFLTCSLVVGCTPRILDGFNYWFQGKNFSLGQLAAKVPPCSQCFKFPFLIMHNGKWFGSVYPGYPLLLVPGMWLNAPWIINPLLGLIGIILTFFFAKIIFDEYIAKISIIFLVISPFYRMMASIFMAHMSALVAVLVSNIMLVIWTRKRKNCSWSIPIILGTSLGFLYITRPQAGAVAVSPFIFYFLLQIKHVKFKHVIVLLSVLAVFIIFLAYYNWVLTGSPFVNVRYFVDPGRRLGFGSDVGEPLPNGSRSGHSIKNGFKNLYILLNLWNSDMEGWGSAYALGLVLLCVIGNFAIKPVSVFELILGSSIVLNFILYFFYFTPSPNFGPRYLAESIPATVILISTGARKWIGFLQKDYRNSQSIFQSFVFYSIILLLCAEMVFFIPLHTKHYGKLPATLKKNNIEIPPDINNAIILVPQKLYTLNMFTWNSPNLDGILFLPEPQGANLELLRESFPQKTFFQMIQGVYGENNLQGKYRLRRIE